MEEFDAVLGDRPNQVDRQRDDVEVTAADLLATSGDARRGHRGGPAHDVNVGIQYISSWLRGNGAAAIYGMMEDAATAEISRSQVWQWVRHGVELDDGRDGHRPSSCASCESEELEKHPQRDRRRRLVRPRAAPTSRASCSSRWRWRTSSWSS